MSYNLNDSPNHFMVLNAISNNFTTIDKITKFSKLAKPEVESILKELENQRLITRTEKKSFFFGKKIHYQTTETGFKILNIKKQELEEKVKEAQQWYSQGDKGQLQSFMESNRAWMPMMLFSGIMDMIFFTSLMSFVGMSLNPMEHSLIGGDYAATTDTGGNVDLQGGDSGSSGGFDFGGGGFDGGGFDGGGFDGF